MARLLVASPCGFVTVFDLTHKSQTHNQKHRQNLAVNSSCQGLFILHSLSLVTSLAPLAGGSRCLSVQAATTRSSLFAASVQPFSHRRFFLYTTYINSSSYPKVKLLRFSLPPSINLVSLNKNSSSVGCSFFKSKAN